MNNDEQDKNQPLPNPDEYFQPNPNVRNNEPPQQPQPAYNQYIDPKKPKSVKKIIIIAVIIALVFFAGLIALVLLSDNKNNPSNSQVADQSNLQTTVPSDWQTIQTDLGFSIKAPKDWLDSESSDTSAGNLEATSLSLRNFDEDNDQESEDKEYLSVIISNQKLTDSSTQQDFEQVVTTIDSDSKAIYEDLGIAESDIKISSTKIKINGQEWLQVDTEIPEQVSRTIYKWVDGYAIALTVNGDDQTALDKLTKDYLLPMAISIEVQ